MLTRIGARALFIVLALLVVVQGAHANGLLETAQQFEARGNYRSAVATYQQYLSANPKKSAETRLARIKLPVLQETIRYGLDAEVVPFLAALDARAIGLTEDALAILQQLIDTYPGGHLEDDAIFMSAYVSIMDHYDFTKAGATLQQLIDSYPDSPYVDTALYSMAIVYEQLGDVDTAVDTLIQLRDRHNSVSIAGVSWAKDSYLSRFWFERANNRLKHLQEHRDNASRLISIEQAIGNGYQYQAVVQSDGREFTLLLNESQLSTAISIVNDQGIPLAPARVTTYEGKVYGIDDSWARISIEDGNLRGLITLHNDQFRLRPRTTGGSLADFHPLLLGDTDGNRATEQDQVLYPPAVGALNTLDLGSRSLTSPDIGGVEGTQTAAFGADRSIMSNDSGTAGSGVNKVAQLGVVVDSKFNNYYAGRGVEQALSILNSSDGIFRQQIGLALNVAKVVLIEDTETDPMNLGSVTMETMMRNFREYRMDSSQLSSNVGLATLFSGNKNSDSALGLAWIGSACRTDGFDVSVVSPYYMAELLSTHEIGHTLGAPHDSETACASQQRNIMWPFLSSNTQQQFSSCSKDSVRSLLAASRCHTNAIDLELDLYPVSNTEVLITLTNQNAELAASGIRINIESPVAAKRLPDNCYQNRQDEFHCTLASLNPSQSVSIQVDLNQPLADTETFLAEVTLNSAIDIETSNNAVELDANGNTTLVNPPGNNYASAQMNLTSNAGGNSTSVGSISPAGHLLLMLLVICYRRRAVGRSL